MQSKSKIHTIKVLVSPSWVSGSISVVFTLLICAFVLIISYKQSGIIGQSLFTVHYASNGLSSAYQVIADNLAHYSLISDVLTIMFWVGIGLFVYYLAVHVYGLITSVVEFEAEIHFIKARRNQLIIDAIGRFALRIAALLAWVILLDLTVRKLFALYLVLAKNLINTASMVNILAFIALTLVFILNFMSQTVLIRLMLLRYRAFGDTVDD